MKNKITLHANERFFDRSNQEVTRKMIINHISNGGAINYAKRMTATRSLAYIPIKDEIFKVIINRKTKKLVSILPFRDAYKRNIIFFSEHYDNKNYHVKLYPDCYWETGSLNVMTKIYTLDENDEITDEIPFNHPFFNGLFNIAWECHLKLKGKTEDEIKTEIKTLTIEKEAC